MHRAALILFIIVFFRFSPKAFTPTLPVTFWVDSYYSPHNASVTLRVTQLVDRNGSLDLGRKLGGKCATSRAE